MSESSQAAAAAQVAAVRLEDIHAAATRIAPFVKRTPVMVSTRINELLGVDACFKCENFQRIGTFKARGAHNAVLSLDDRFASRGVVTHSSGNHAAALSLAARTRGIPAYIAMPENAPRSKIESVRRLGGQVRFCASNMAAREAMAAEIMAETGAALVHPYDDFRVIAGQGTAALELIEDEPGLDAVIAPVGGGGLMSGTAVAARASVPGIRIIASEPAQADDAYRSWRAGRRIVDGRPDTIADGLRTTVGIHTFALLGALLDDFVIVSEEEIVTAMRLVWEVMKIIIEPSSAVAVAALGKCRADLAGQRVGVIISGGNVDLDRLPWARTDA